MLKVECLLKPRMNLAILKSPKLNHTKVLLWVERKLWACPSVALHVPISPTQTTSHHPKAAPEQNY